MTTLVKYWRLAADDYEPPAGTVDAFDGQRHASEAETRLRSALESGRTRAGGVVLVAPERATVAEIDADGRMTGVCCWREGDGARNGLSHTPSPAVTMYIESDDYQPDPVSATFADLGSVVVRSGTVTRIDLAPAWAACATSLQDRYGVEVRVVDLDGLDRASAVQRVIQVDSRGPEVWHNMLRPEHMDAMVDYFREQGSDPAYREAQYAGEPNQVEGRQPPAEFITTLRTMALVVAARFGLPVHESAIAIAMARYAPGCGQDWHLDCNPGFDPRSEYRTVSYSVLLSEPGTHFEGGELEFDTGMPEMHRGTLCGFTARTRHRVNPVTVGERYVLICFAGVPL